MILCLLSHVYRLKCLKSETLPTYLLTRVKSRDASASKKTFCPVPLKSISQTQHKLKLNLKLSLQNRNNRSGLQGMMSMEMTIVIAWTKLHFSLRATKWPVGGQRTVDCVRHCARSFLFVRRSIIRRSGNSQSWCTVSGYLIQCTRYTSYRYMMYTLHFAVSDYMIQRPLCVFLRDTWYRACIARYSRRSLNE